MAEKETSDSREFVTDLSTAFKKPEEKRSVVAPDISESDKIRINAAAKYTWLNSLKR